MPAPQGRGQRRGRAAERVGGAGGPALALRLQLPRDLLQQRLPPRLQIVAGCPGLAILAVLAHVEQACPSCGRPCLRCGCANSGCTSKARLRERSHRTWRHCSGEGFCAFVWGSSILLRTIEGAPLERGCLPTVGIWPGLHAATVEAVAEELRVPQDQ